MIRKFKTRARLGSPSTRLILPGAAFLSLISLGAEAVAAEYVLPYRAPLASIQLAARTANEFQIVDCLLPGQLRKLGRMATFVTARRPIKTSVRDCEIRGGEYVAEDRGSYAHALKVWLPKAKSGDPKAQTFLGEIFEKGLGLEPNYRTAAQWYRKAAVQGDSTAQINLGNLYEKGLGVPRDPKQALEWYRKASGLGEVGLEFVSAGQVNEVKRLRGEVARRKQETEQLRSQIARLQGDLGKARRRLNQRRNEAKKQSRNLNQANRTLAAEKSRIIRSRRVLDAERKRLANLEATYNGRLTAMQQSGGRQSAAELRAAQVRLKDEQDKVVGLQDELQKLRHEVANAAARRADRHKLEAERKRLVGLEADHRRRLDQLERSRRESAGKISRKEQQRTAQLQEQIDRLREDVKRRASRTAKQDSQLVAERKRLARVEADYKRQVSELEKARLEAESRMSLEQRKRAAKFRQELSQLRAEVAKREATIAKQDAQLAGREQEVGDKRLQLAALDSELKKLKRDTEQRRAKLTKLTEASRSRAASEPPSIELIDPKIKVVTRGIPVVRMRGKIKTRVIVGRIRSATGLMTLVVNDREEKIDKEGLFRSRVPVLPNGTRVSIVAIDRRGKKSDLEFMLQPAGAKQIAGTVQSATDDVLKMPSVNFGKYYALVIGNNNNRFLPKLDTAVADANVVSGILKKKYGFKVKTLLNATRYNILSAMNELRKTLTEKDNLLIYYAGHGELDKVNQRGHWLPVDAEPGSTANWISNVNITDMLNAMSAKQIMVVADSCYSGALTRSALARLEAGMSQAARATWVSTIIKKRARVAMTSGGLQPVLDAGGGKHSIFASAFIDVLRRNTGVLEARRMHQEVSARVTYAADAVRYDQLPEYAPIRHAGHGGGEFFFVARGS